MSRIGILTSGGDSPGMNAAIRSIVRTAIYCGHEALGIYSGYQGLVDDEIRILGLSSVADIIHRGGTILGTSRCPAFEKEEGRKKALRVLDHHGIDKVIVLGGDGSFKGALALVGEGVDVLGIPCTIDNDLGYTDYTIGFFTAVETITEAIGRIRDTSSSHERGHIIEVMGRTCGDLALYAGISGGAESILVPEEEFSLDRIVQKILRGKNRGKRHHIILLTEGLKDPYKLANEIQNQTDVETKVTILGYVQRGGSPNISDRIMATNLGAQGVLALEKGKGALAMGFKNNRAQVFNLEEALEVKKTFSKTLYQELEMVSI